MSVRNRLAELGLSLPAVAAPAGVYVPAVTAGSLVFTSGQLPLVNGSLARTGLVGVDVTPEEAAADARACILHALAAVEAEIGSLDRVTRIVKVTAYVASAAGFTAQPAVANGASALLGDLFGDAGRHARAAVGVASLPLNAPVELDLTAAYA